MIVLSSVFVVFGLDHRFSPAFWSKRFFLDDSFTLLVPPRPFLMTVSHFWSKTFIFDDSFTLLVRNGQNQPHTGYRIQVPCGVLEVSFGVPKVSIRIHESIRIYQNLLESRIQETGYGIQHTGYRIQDTGDGR